MKTVALIAFEGLSPFHFSVPLMVFCDELLAQCGAGYRVLVCGERRGQVGARPGISITVDHDLGALDGADTVILPAWRDPKDRPSAELVTALQAAHARGARIVGLCLGSFVLAEAGLLDGRAASTHWQWADQFAARFPRVALNRNALYVDEGDIVTSAGTAAALDCCLHLLRNDHGADIANRLARSLVIAPHRHGAQAQYIETLLPQSAQPDPLDGALNWAIAHLDAPMSLQQLADHAGMSLRSFTRHFRKKTGATFTQWLLNHRLAMAQRLLETSTCSIDRIAAMSGFGSTVSFRQQFTRAFAQAPARYRKAWLERPVLERPVLKRPH